MIGDLGETAAKFFLSKKTSQGVLFKTIILDGKWPTIDIYAEVTTDDQQKMICFFQVKTTEQGYTKRKRKLKIKIDERDLNRLSKYSAPTYIIGVDHNPTNLYDSQAYIITVRGDYTSGINGLPTAFPLNEANLFALRQEVIAYWNMANSLSPKENYFTNFSL